MSPEAPDFAQGLNEQQLAAVQTTARHALVIAGAGSGKTRTLTWRVAWLLQQGIAPWRILLLTFTNKAAREMLGRVQELTAESATSVWGGTFHSVANRILRRHAELIGYRAAYTIMDGDDQSALMKALVKQWGDVGVRDKKVFPKPPVLLSIHSLAVNTGRDWQDIVREEHPHAKPFIDTIAQIYAAYAKRKIEGNMLDFDDLLRLLVKLFEEHPEVASYYREQFAHVLVDEYQDTNRLQDRMIQVLAGGAHSHLMVVGDDAQSIYSWRGAEVEHILRFEEQYPAAEIYKIETNYRSVPAILELSNAAIAQNTRQFAKELRSARESSAQLPQVVNVNSKRAEARYITQRIDELMGGGEIQGQDIAILYRAHFHAMDLQLELTRQHIPFRITSGLRFFEQAHVKDAMSYLRLLINPRDEMALRRLLAMMPKIGAVTSNKVWLNWLAKLERQESLREQFSTQMGELAGIPKAAKANWQAAMHALDKMGSGSPHELIALVIEQLTPYLQASYENHEERIEDLHHMVDAAPHIAELDDFLAEISLLGQLDQEGTGDESERVTLSTIHQAKGLEWKVVFVLGLSDGLFPHSRVIERGDLTGMEEELRLFYVACTRAQDRLYLMYPRFAGGYDGQFCPPSRFLRALPAEAYEQDRWYD